MVSSESSHSNPESRSAAEIVVDGSYGEGGGQIIRTAITLSCITGKSVEVYNIRKGRKTPGLRPQHLAGVKLLGKLFNARVEGVQVGSTKVRFFPGNITDDLFLEYDIGTAGSIPLLLQMIIPTVSLCQKSCKTRFRGGTDVLWSPTANYMAFVLRHAYSRIGIDFQMSIKKRGYYPRGGGIVETSIEPAEKIRAVSLMPQKDSDIKKDANVVLSYSGLSYDRICKKMQDVFCTLKKKNFSYTVHYAEQDAIDRGASVLIYSNDSHHVVGCDAVYSSPDDIRADVAERFSSNFWFGVDENLSDMLTIPLGLAREKSEFTVRSITKHLETNLFVASRFQGIKYDFEKLVDSSGYRVTMSAG